ncbi:unnamed protein product [Penicillium roqueforti FM164]|uniref:Uncharacterized protein n=1 Tax=Penicillium roqueforti (strain FM164) TaxID=1365484 RepID=W6R6Y5_PENRF|nr:unnamed protein product [Penicillium roqueforti FM164]
MVASPKDQQRTPEQIEDSESMVPLLSIHERRDAVTRMHNQDSVLVHFQRN